MDLSCANYEWAKSYHREDRETLNKILRISYGVNNILPRITRLKFKHCMLYCARIIVNNIKDFYKVITEILM